MRQTDKKINTGVGVSSVRERIADQPQEQLVIDEYWNAYSTKSFESIIRLMAEYTEEQINHNLYDEVVKHIKVQAHESEIEQKDKSSESFLYKGYHESIQQRSLARSIFNFLKPIHVSKKKLISFPSPKSVVDMYESDLDEQGADCQMIFGSMN